MMKQLFSLTLLMLIMVTAICAQTFSSDSLAVVVQGGKVTLSPTDNPKNGFAFTFSQIQEIAKDGGVANAVNAFSGNTFQVSPVQNTTFQGVPALTVSISTTMQVVSSGSSATNSSQLIFKIYLFTGKGTIKEGSASYSVDSSHADMSYTLSGWPVASSANKINFRYRITTASKSGELDGTELVLYNGASVKYPSTAEASSGTVAAKPSISAKSNTVDVTVQFGASSTIVYNTVFGLGAERSAASSLVSPFSLLYQLFC